MANIRHKPNQCTQRSLTGNQPKNTHATSKKDWGNILNEFNYRTNKSIDQILDDYEIDDYSMVTSIGNNCFYNPDNKDTHLVFDNSTRIISWDGIERLPNIEELACTSMTDVLHPDMIRKIKRIRLFTPKCKTPFLKNFINLEEIIVEKYCEYDAIEAMLGADTRYNEEYPKDHEPYDELFSYSNLHPSVRIMYLFSSDGVHSLKDIVHFEKLEKLIISYGQIKDIDTLLHSQSFLNGNLKSVCLPKEHKISTNDNEVSRILRESDVNIAFGY